MVRTRPPQRLEEIVEAAIVVFGRLGFRRAQMADVARQAGVAPGTLYTYVESKEALFALVLERASNPAATPPAVLPVPSPTTADLFGRLEKGFTWTTGLPALHAALDRKRVTNPRRELQEIVEELWELIDGSRRVADVIERSARDWPELADLFYRRLRRTLFADLTTYVERRAARGHLRSTAHPEVVARFVIETITWFGRHRHGDPDTNLDDDAVRAEVVSLIVNALAHGA
jgi:AcrR family transcriptional regulator